MPCNVVVHDIEKPTDIDLGDPEWFFAVVATKAHHEVDGTVVRHIW